MFLILLLWLCGYCNVFVDPDRQNSCSHGAPVPMEETDDKEVNRLIKISSVCGQ